MAVYKRSQGDFLVHAHPSRDRDVFVKALSGIVQNVSNTFVATLLMVSMGCSILSF